MNVCGVALLAVSLLACSGQKKGAEATESASDAVKVTAEATSAQADSTGYIVRIEIGRASCRERVCLYV